jgi:hypothetical protein
LLGEYDSPGIGLAALLLSMNTLLIAEKKGVLSQAQAIEVVSHAILNLQEHERSTTPAGQSAVESARSILQQLKSVVSGPIEKL